MASKCLFISAFIFIVAVSMLFEIATLASLTERESEIVLRRWRRNYESGGHLNNEDPRIGEKPRPSVTTEHISPGNVLDYTAIFATENCTTVQAQIGGTATLPCVLRKLSSGVVSWIRRVDYHLLTVGLATYSSDDRFLVEHVRHLQNWGLQIKFVQRRDAGTYECQVSTHPPTSVFIHLQVIEAAAVILGAPDLHIKSGSVLKLVCILRQSTEPPVFVFWYHDSRMINYDAAHGVRVYSDSSSSILTIKEVDKNDNGNYTCLPSNAKPASINVHVLNSTAGEHPAAMQHANTSNTASAGSRVQSHSVASSTIILAVACFIILHAVILQFDEQLISVPSTSNMKRRLSHAYTLGNLEPRWNRLPSLQNNLNQLKIIMVMLSRRGVPFGTCTGRQYKLFIFPFLCTNNRIHVACSLAVQSCKFKIEEIFYEHIYRRTENQCL